MNQEKITGRLITRNWLLNLLGQGIPLFLGLLTIPWLLRYLGIERFGILSIAWAVLGYVGQFDLGLGRATTKFVAECLGRGDIEKLPALIWTSVFSQLVFGGLAAFLLLALTPALSNHILKISSVHLLEMKMVLLILAGSIPLVIATNSLRGVLEADQQFTLINYIKIPANISVFLLPVLGIPLAIGLPGIVLLLVLSRLATVLAYLLACFRIFPSLRQRIALDLSLLRIMFAYGSWVTVSNLISPLLTYVDRFFIGAIISMAAVGYYTAPYEIVTKIWLLPSSLLATVFPAFSALQARESGERMEELYVRSVKSILITAGPVLLILAAFARQILGVWLGPQFASRSASTLQILALGVFINCISFVPFGMLQGLGRPDLTAKFHMVESPFYVLVLWVLLKSLGLPGAAWAWTIRVAVDTVLLFLAVFKLKFVSRHPMMESPLRRAILALVLPAVLLPLSWINSPLMVQLTACVCLMAIFVMTVWAYVLDMNERSMLVGAAIRFRIRLAGGK